MKFRKHATDLHRRGADAAKQAELIRGHNQAKENAKEWLRRGQVAQAKLVLAPFGYRFDRVLNVF